MDEKRKASVRRALEKFLDKEMQSQNPKTKTTKNKSPEKIVEAECLQWLRQNGCDVEVYQSKATYDPVRRMYRQQSMKAGNADIQGTMLGGIGVYVELKAPKKLSTFASPKNQRQIDFITRKINTDAFSVVVDSTERLEAIYIMWQKQRAISLEAARIYLTSMLPTRRRNEKDQDEELF